MKTRRNTIFLVIGIIMSGVIMRTPFAAISPIMTRISSDLNMTVGELGILTTIPGLAFGLFAPIGPALVKKLGLINTFMLTFIILAIGSQIRTISAAMLFLGTTLIGFGISQLNVLLPVLVSEFFEQKIDKMTGLYAFSMSISVAIFTALVVPITNQSGWRSAITVITSVIVVAIILWTPNIFLLKRSSRQKDQNTSVVKENGVLQNKRNFWKNGTAWYMMIFFGIFTGIYFISISWLPTVAIFNGVDAQLAGVLGGVNALVGIPMAFIMPLIAARCTKGTRRNVLLFATFMSFISFVMILFPITQPWYWIAINVINGVSVGSFFPYMMASIGTKTNSYQETMQLSSMVQFGGFLIAAIFPLLFGMAFGWFNAYNPQIIVVAGSIILMGIAAIGMEEKNKI